MALHFRFTLLFTLAAAACTPSRTRYDVRRVGKPMVIDGAFDDWHGIEAINGFTRSTGDGPSRLRTTARIAHDATNLYVAFSTDDPDIRATLTEHDAPIYKEEAVEMFIETHGGSGDYIELQSSPRGVTFDAAFTGGARNNMQRGFDADFEAACLIDGTLNDGTDVDRGWRCEWRVGLASIPGALPIKNGTIWRANLFRIAKDGDPVKKDESAWCAPMRGDFHVLDRFGELIFHDP